MARGDGNTVADPSASPFPQPICERELAQTSVAGGAGSWCEHLNPFILPRPVDVPSQLDVGKFASLGLQLGAGPSQHVAESRDIGNLTSEVRGEQPTTFLPRRHGQERGSC